VEVSIVIEYPRVLVFSNNCFSKTDSNGRTLGNFFIGWPKDKLAQFYIQSAEPDFDYCSNYYRVTDSQALRSVYSNSRGGVIKPKNEVDVFPKNNSTDSIKHQKRNAMTMLVRDVVWSLRRWMNQEYRIWVNAFQPDIVLLQAGDCPFMFDIAVQTAKEYRAKLVIFNTEGYYFKDFDYFKSYGIPHTLYPVFRARLISAMNKAYKLADYAIFNCDSLNEDFSKEFSVKSEVIYTTSKSTKKNNEKESTSEFVVSYAGNLGVGRPQSLIEIANTLHDINQDYYLDIYGTIPNESVHRAFSKCEGIRFHGRISYEEVQNIMQDSDLLIHVESFDPYYKKDLKYAFSTKIADCLASNRCFMMYAPTDFEETRYLLQNNAAFVVPSSDKLVETLQLLIKCPDVRSKYIKNALKLYRQNHNQDVAMKKFQKILCNL